MKRGFTLIEMLIVVTILGILMSIVFRLSSVGSDNSSKSTTIARLQRVAFCLSGYYAAFGTYPPVALHGTRNINAQVDSYGIQSLTQDNNINWSDQYAAWRQVEPACRSQPVDCAFPFPDWCASRVSSVASVLREKCNNSDIVQEWREKYHWNDDQQTAVLNKLQSGFDAISANNNRFSGLEDETEWTELQLFKFGLMSYILPRYLVMMNASDDSLYTSFAQWSANNTLPSDALTGDKFDQEWSGVYNAIKDGSGISGDKVKFASVANIPSQAVTARWLPNLEGMCTSEHSWDLFGINITGSTAGNVSSDNPMVNIYVPGNGTGQQYVLDTITICDGWGNTFYYYSPAPYQDYVLWSAGANWKTFPPWIPLDSSDLDSQARSTAAEWIKDDIVNLSTD